jgi:hypothetical protein
MVAFRLGSPASLKVPSAAVSIGGFGLLVGAAEAEVARLRVDRR